MGKSFTPFVFSQHKNFMVDGSERVVCCMALLCKPEEKRRVEAQVVVTGLGRQSFLALHIPHKSGGDGVVERYARLFVLPPSFFHNIKTEKSY